MWDDLSTSFLKASSLYQTRNNRILGLKDGVGNRSYDSLSIKSSIQAHFTTLFSTQQDYSPFNCAPLLSWNGLPLIAIYGLPTPPTSAEIYKALFNSSRIKAQVLMGFILFSSRNYGSQFGILFFFGLHICFLNWFYS